MRWRLAVAVAVFLAGCSGVSAPGGVGSTETATLTPVAVPERGTHVGTTPRTATPENRLLPGLTAEGVTDPFALAGAHRDALRNRSFTRVTHTTLAGPNGTLRTTHEVIAVAPGGRRYHYTITSASDPSYPVHSITPRLEIWYTDGPALFRLDEGENASYRVGMTGTLEGPVGDISGQDRLVGLYGTVDRWSVQPASGEDHRLFVLESREPPDADVLKLPTLVTDPRNVELQVVLTGDGRVVTHRLSYDATFDDQPVRVVRHVRFVKVGSTTVTEPDWLDEAQRETNDERRGSG